MAKLSPEHHAKLTSELQKDADMPFVNCAKEYEGLWNKLSGRRRREASVHAKNGDPKKTASHILLAREAWIRRLTPQKEIKLMLQAYQQLDAHTMMLMQFREANRVDGKSGLVELSSIARRKRTSYQGLLQ